MPEKESIEEVVDRIKSITPSDCEVVIDKGVIVIRKKGGINHGR